MIEEFQHSNSLKYYTEADIHVDFFQILEKELNRRNCLFFDENYMFHKEK